MTASVAQPASRSDPKLKRRRSGFGTIRVTVTMTFGGLMTLALE